MTTHQSPSTIADKRISHTLRAELALVSFLIVLDMAARVLPHAPNWSPLAATALFAGTVVSRRALALAVPLVALFLSDVIIGFDHAPILAVVYAGLTLPAILPMVFRRLRAPGMFVPTMALCSILFFVASNVAVWAAGDLYPRTLAGLSACFVAALPFLQHTVIGDMAWAVSLFGSAWLVRKLLSRAAVPAGSARQAV